MTKLKWMNKQHLPSTSPHDLVSFLSSSNLLNSLHFDQTKFRDLVEEIGGGNIKTFKDHISTILSVSQYPPINKEDDTFLENRDILEELVLILDQEQNLEQIFDDYKSSILEPISSKLNKKGKGLFHPIRFSN